jgi:glutathione S-transferase
MYTLYIANKNYSSWSLRPWAVMTELGIPFEENLVVFADGPNWEEFRKFSPSGLVPCLKDGEVTIWESLAIVEYLAERHPGVWPEDAVARAWARSATAEMHGGFSALRNQCSMTCGQRVQLHEFGDSLKKDLDRLQELWTEGLGNFGGPFLTGQSFTAVDAFYAPVAFRIQTYGLPLKDKSAAYVQSLLNTDSIQAWYEEALKEPWREAAHEEEIAAVGTVIADYRTTD